jgi:hypothetical protein
MVPRLLTPEQKEIWMNVCADILQNIENDPNVLENVIQFKNHNYVHIKIKFNIGKIINKIYGINL